MRVLETEEAGTQFAHYHLVIQAFVRVWTWDNVAPTSIIANNKLPSVSESQEIQDCI